MTYPDRQPMTNDRRWLFLVVVAFLVLYIAFAVEAKARQAVCVSAMIVDATGTTVYPQVCQ